MNICPIIKVFIFISLILLIYYNQSSTEDNYKSHIKKLRQTSSECTLFLNKNDEFPIDKPCKVLLIGSGARNTVKGGLGSADVESSHYTTCEQGLENAGFEITSKEWLDKYIKIKEGKIMEHLNYIKNLEDKYKGTDSFRMVAFPEYEYKLDIKDEKMKADIAVYVIARNSGEGFDRRLIKGDALLTNKEIKDILYLDKKYKKFMLVLNVGGVVDLSPVKTVSNILLLSQLGVVTGDILADIILGKQNPSGKLATTWASIKDYKFMKYFGDINDINYKEGVYVGYRYFNSAVIKPLYPFGYGKSYTDFDISKISLKNKKDQIIIKVRVKNIGKYPGKEVIQVYVSPSQKNKDKPYQSLVAFQKTKELKPFNEQDIELKFKLGIVARYDEVKSCYILDSGKYIIRVGNNSEKTKVYGYIELDSDIITEKLKNIYKGYKIGFKDYNPKIVLKDDLSNIQNIKLTENDFDCKSVDYNYNYQINKKLLELNLNDSELAYLCVGDFPNKEKERGLAGSTTKQIKKIKNYIRMADGPSGLRIANIYNIDPEGKIKRLNPNPVQINAFAYYKNLISNKKKISLTINQTKNYSNYTNIIYQNATAFPISTAVAQSFNTDLAEKYGKMIGKEMNIFNIQLWLAPALNIHRNILCGRNFEYFSEDPLITGKMAAAITRGVQFHKNRGVTLKHFAANNQEFNRLNSNSRMSERTLREIYLKGFQIAIEESKPFAIMTSYNLINGIHSAENKGLLIDILRTEWNFKGLIMTDWASSGRIECKKSKYPPLNTYNNIKGGNNIIMEGNIQDFNILINKTEEGLLKRDDLLRCASKVYDAIELLNKWL